MNKEGDFNMNELVFALICTPFLMIILGVYVIRTIQKRNIERVKQKLEGYTDLDNRHMFTFLNE